MILRRWFVKFKGLNFDHFIQGSDNLDETIDNIINIRITNVTNKFLEQCKDSCNEKNREEEFKKSIQCIKESRPRIKAYIQRGIKLVCSMYGRTVSKDNYLISCVDLFKEYTVGTSNIYTVFNINTTEFIKLWKDINNNETLFNNILTDFEKELIQNCCSKLLQFRFTLNNKIKLKGMSNWLFGDINCLSRLLDEMKDDTYYPELIQDTIYDFFYSSNFVGLLYEFTKLLSSNDNSYLINYMLKIKKEEIRVLLHDISYIETNQANLYEHFQDSCGVNIQKTKLILKDLKKVFIPTNDISHDWL